MTKLFAGINDYVYYRDIKSIVEDVAIYDAGSGESTVLKHSTVSQGGVLYYSISNPEYESHWVPARDCILATEDSSFYEADARSPHLEELGYSMVGWMDGLEARPDNNNIPPVVTLLMAIQYDKEGSYGSSWKGKGEYRGIMANIDRKYDRLDKMTQDEIEGLLQPLGLLEDHIVKGRPEGDQIGESKIDAIADLANYCLLYLTYVKEHFPLVFQIWVDKNVPNYLRDKIPFIQGPSS